jgi:hypothetical protein
LSLPDSLRVYPEMTRFPNDRQPCKGLFGRDLTGAWRDWRRRH